MKYNCLIVDDEEVLAESTAEYFNLFGVSTAAVFSPQGCLDFLEENSVDLILLDINWNTGCNAMEQTKSQFFHQSYSSGFELCRKLREMTQIPILFISARQSDDDILLALHIGGDDYIRKPYALSVLLAKVKVVLKRLKIQQEETYTCGRLMVDFHSGRIFLDGNPIKLQAMEYKLLCYLIQNKGRVIPKEELFSHVWADTFTSDGTLNVHIRHLREKIEEDANHPVFIQTIWGVGYLFEETVK